jgi:single-strand DNA-binding protein
MNVNKAIVCGNLTRDPEAKTLPSGQSISNFGVATNRIWNDQDGNRQEATEFHNIVAFGKLAEICNQYLARGRLVYIDGRIQTRSWDDQDGNKKYRTEIVAETMQMGPRPAGASGEAPGSRPSPQTESKPVQVEKKNDDEIKIEDIPF